MSSQLPIPEPDTEDLSAEEYIEIPDWHREIIEERLAKYQANGFEGRTWEELEPELIEFEQKLIEELTKK